MSRVPRNETARCPAFLDNCIIIFSLPIILHFCLVTQQSDELPVKLGPYFARRQTPSIFHAWQPPSCNDCLFFNARRQHTATVSDVPWVVDSDWIIASVLCFPYYRVSDQMAKPPLKTWRRGENASLTTIGGAILLG